MSVEENKRVVLQFVGSLMSTMDESLLSEDVEWWLMGLGTFSLAQIKEVISLFPYDPDNPIVVRVEHATAEEDRVAISARGSGRLRDGRLYENTYSYLFFVKEGKIVKILEYYDSFHARNMVPADSIAREAAAV
jgi:ketosteroid isomerase-like protein